MVCNTIKFKEYTISVQADWIYMKGSVVMAVINVTPFTDITDLISSDNVNEGDVLLLEEGIYFQTVNVIKRYWNGTYNKF